MLFKKFVQVAFVRKAKLIRDLVDAHIAELQAQLYEPEPVSGNKMLQGLPGLDPNHGEPVWDAACRLPGAGMQHAAEVRDQAEPSLAVCACLTGLLAESLTQLGAHSIEINKTSCEAVGDPACVYSATWV